METTEFIRLHADDDVRQLALQGDRYPEVDMKHALQQIAGRQKARTKLPSWAATDGIVYPPHLSMEQCSSEFTARYKARIAGEGSLFVDLTAGFGVDAAWISKGFSRAVTVERQEQLCAISSENFRVLGLNHIEVVCGDGVDYLHGMSHADLIFIDPARRDEHGARTYGLADCTPNVLELIGEMLEKADRIMMKLSPMLDWRKAVADVGHVSEVHIVSVDNECKELILLASRNEQPLRVICVNGDEVFEFAPDDAAVVSPPPPQAMPRYLYEPNASVMKAGCYDLLSERFGLAQLDRNSHLFVSDTKRELREALSGIGQANIAARNFPMSVAQLRERLKLKDGGETYIFATKVANRGFQLFVCRKKS